MTSENPPTSVGDKKKKSYATNSAWEDNSPRCQQSWKRYVLGPSQAARQVAHLSTACGIPPPRKHSDSTNW